MNVEWCDFVVYSNNEIVIDCIIADYNYWVELSETLDRFYVQHIVPEILSGKIFMEEYGSFLEFLIVSHKHVNNIIFNMELMDYQSLLKTYIHN